MASASPSPPTQTASDALLAQQTEALRLEKEAATPPKPDTIPEPKGPDLRVKLVCKNCRDPVPNIVEDFKNGELLCGTCGLVFQDRIIDTRSEWRTFSNDEGGDDPSRVGAPADHIMGANRLESTGIGADDGTGRGSALARRQAAVSRGAGGLREAFRDIDTVCERMGIPRQVADTAKLFFRKVDEEKLARGKSPEAVKAACIYIASQQHKETRSFKELVAATNVDKHAIGKVYKAIRAHFIRNKEATAAGPDFKSLIERVANQLGLDYKLVNHANKLVESARKANVLAGRQWTTLVGACIYAVSSILPDERMRKSAAEIAPLCGCTDATLRGAYHELYEHRAELMPAEDYKAVGDVALLMP